MALFPRVRATDVRNLRTRAARRVRYLVPVALAVLGARAQADERPHYDARDLAPPVLLAGTAAVTPSVFVASSDSLTGAPTFLWAIHDADRPQGVSQGGASLLGISPEQAARIHLADLAELYGLSAPSLATAEVVRVLDVGRGGITVVLRQRVGGIDLFRSDVKVLMTRDLELVAIGGNLHPAAVPSPKLAAFQLSEAQAVATAFDDLFGASLKPSDLLDLKRTKGDYHYYDLGASKAASLSGVKLVVPARVKRVYFPLPGRIVPAFYVEVAGGPPTSTSSESYAYVIAGDDGRLLYRENLTHADTFNYRVWADATGEKRPLDGPLVDYTPYPFAVSNGSYPGFTSPSLVAIDGFNKNADPWLATGATTSQGNNVDAYTDDEAPDGYSPGDTRAFVTSPGTFDLTYDVTKGPQSSLLQREASITQLFYVTNWLHDWWYDSGFDEAGGNAQVSNYGRGGVEGDPLLAEGQDGAPTSRNNSNMSVPADGSSPRMQMYVWDGAPVSLTLTPGNASLLEGQADFGPTTFQTTGTVVLVDDGVAPNTDACQPIVNNVSGQIALIDRGTCSFKFKAVNAQASGAIGVILVDNAAGQAPHLFDDPSITTAVTIPMVSVSQSDGATIETALASGTATATLVNAFDYDGTIDDTVIAHEWGHYLHLRHVACGSPACSAESEGWADFNALMTIVRPGDNLDGSYALAQYAVVSFPDPAYFGIRRFPYSVDFTKDPLTFKNITSGQALPTTAPVSPNAGQSDNSEVHAAGEIWAAMLFEGYVGLLKQSALPTPPYTFVEARRRMGDYVVGGMTMAPASPTYTEQRDGVLAAAAAADQSDLAILAQGFAKRGAGTCAVSPARDSTDFSGVVESFTVAPNLSVDSIAVDDSVVSCDNDGYLDAGETGKITVHVTNNGAGATADATATVTTDTAGVTFPQGSKIDFGAMGIFSAKSASIEIALDPSVMGKQKLHLTVTSDAAGCTTATREDYFPANVDEVAASSTTDDVEARTTTWKPTDTKIWSRVEGAMGNHVWAGIDYSAPSDTSLVSPPLDVSATDHLVMTFTHRHSFENSMSVNWDGAVIEVSPDAGATWQDISMYGNPGYGGTIGDPQNQAMNALKGRKGYVATNPSWPASDPVMIDLGTGLAGKTIKVRFRIGTDDAVGNVGWQIDDIGFQGITNQPFASLVDNMTPCNSPSTTSTTGAGGGTGAGGARSSKDAQVQGAGCNCEAAGTGTGATGAAAVMLGLSSLLRRRRRRGVAGRPVAR